MSKKKITIEFKNIHQLWEFAQCIHSTNIEIITNERFLICDCTEEDLELLTQYSGKIIEEDTSSIYIPPHKRLG